MTEKGDGWVFHGEHGKLKQERQNATNRVIARPKGWQWDEVVAISGAGTGQDSTLRVAYGAPD